MKKLSLLYQVSTLISLIGWVLIIGFPNENFTDKTVLNIVVVLLALIYGYGLIFQRTSKGEKYPKGSFKNFDGVVKFFKNPKVILIGWVHFLAFDLIVGLYIKNDAIANGINFLWIIPSLLLTIFFGPIGFLSYYLLKLILL